MKCAVVPSHELSPKTLCAQDYVYAYRLRAEGAVKRWKEEHDPTGLLNIRSKGLKALVSVIEAELIDAYQAGTVGR